MSTIDYRLDELGWFEFEQLVQTLSKARLGLGVEAWGGRGDWGRDAYFEGRLRYPANEESDGPFVFQSKFVENANAAGAKPEKLLVAAVQKETKKISENLANGKWCKEPNCYGLFTNTPCPAALHDSVHSLLREALPHAHISIHDGGDICQWLRRLAEIVKTKLCPVAGRKLEQDGYIDSDSLEMFFEICREMKIPPEIDLAEAWEDCLEDAKSWIDDREMIWQDDGVPGRIEEFLRVLNEFVPSILETPEIRQQLRQIHDAILERVTTEENTSYESPKDNDDASERANGYDGLHKHFEKLAAVPVCC